MKISAKTVLAGIAGLYFLWCAYDPQQWHLIDGVSLVIHEAGHVVFTPFGEFVMIAGGSLFQVIVPAVFAGYFFYNRQPYSGALVLFWVGESLLNVSVYAGDAVVRQLPLLGGQDSMHDWAYLLEETGLIGSTRQIAGVIRLAGTLVIVGGLILAILDSISDKNKNSELTAVSF
jgi:hypothetical protein